MIMLNHWRLWGGSIESFPLEHIAKYSKRPAKSWSSKTILDWGCSDNASSMLEKKIILMSLNEETSRTWRWFWGTSLKSHHRCSQYGLFICIVTWWCGHHAFPCRLALASLFCSSWQSTNFVMRLGHTSSPAIPSTFLINKHRDAHVWSWTTIASTTHKNKVIVFLYSITLHTYVHHCPI